MTITKTYFNKGAVTVKLDIQTGQSHECIMIQIERGDVSEFVFLDREDVEAIVKQLTGWLEQKH